MKAVTHPRCSAERRSRLRRRRPVLVIALLIAVVAAGTLSVPPTHAAGPRSPRVEAPPVVCNIPSEIRLGSEHGLREPCVASFDNITPITKSLLTERIGTLGPSAALLICEALESTAGC